MSGQETIPESLQPGTEIDLGEAVPQQILDAMAPGSVVALVWSPWSAEGVFDSPGNLSHYIERLRTYAAYRYVKISVELKNLNPIL